MSVFALHGDVGIMMSLSPIENFEKEGTFIVHTTYYIPIAILPSLPLERWRLFFNYLTPLPHRRKNKLIGQSPCHSGAMVLAGPQLIGKVDLKSALQTELVSSILHDLDSGEYQKGSMLASGLI